MGIGIAGLLGLLIWGLAAPVRALLSRLPWTREWLPGAYVVWGEGASAEDILLGPDESVDAFLQQYYR